MTFHMFAKDQSIKALKNPCSVKNWLNIGPRGTCDNTKFIVLQREQHLNCLLVDRRFDLAPAKRMHYERAPVLQ